LTGTSHEKKGVGCQDACGTIVLNNGWVVAAIADGVGSCKYSDVASQIAVDVSLQVCADAIEEEPDCELLKVIEEAFIQAEREIDRYSLAQDHPLSEYDTTLSLVIYDGGYVWYGHCGDGGIVGLNKNGDYIKITTPQKKEGIYVVPLRAGKESWIIGDMEEEEFASILLATDGVYDAFFPYLLKNQSIEVYVPLIRYFMDDNLLNISKKNIKAIEQERVDFLCSDSCTSITDDKTVLVLFSDTVRSKEKSADFYAEPDWETLQLEWNKKAYPHLYENKDENETPDIFADQEQEDEQKHAVNNTETQVKESEKKKSKWRFVRG